MDDVLEILVITSGCCAMFIIAVVFLELILGLFFREDRVRRTPSGNPCAWCMREHGIEPNPMDSHGICKQHADRMIRERYTDYDNE